MLPIKFPNICFNFFRLMAIPCLHIEIINNKKTQLPNICIGVISGGIKKQVMCQYPYIYKPTKTIK